MNISTHLNHSLCIVHSAFCIALLIAGSANADPSISNVSARQRWPWNSLVDVDFSVDGAAAGEAYAVSVSGTAIIGGKDATFYAKTFATEPIAKSGANRVVWDFGADYPDTKVDDLLVTVTATPFSDTTPLYLVVDVSGGASAAKWPFHYTTTAPVHTAGVEDPCKNNGDLAQARQGRDNDLGCGQWQLKSPKISKPYLHIDRGLLPRHLPRHAGAVLQPLRFILLKVHERPISCDPPGRFDEAGLYHLPVF